MNWRNLPRSCGGCHIGPFVAFQKSAHFDLLKEGDEDSPNCSICHGEVAANLLSPKRLASQCKPCHGDPGGDSYHPDYSALGQLLLELVSETRALLSQAPPLIERIEDADRRARFEEAYQQAEVPLIEAVNTAHSFDFAELEERLTLAPCYTNWPIPSARPRDWAAIICSVPLLTSTNGRWRRGCLP